MKDITRLSSPYSHPLDGGSIGLRLRAWFRLLVACTAFFLVIGMVSVKAQEIGFVERFALAEDRAEVLKELVPGTEDYYFYHALHYQNTGEVSKFDEILGQWKKRVPRSSRRTMLEHRQALIGYDRDPEASVEYLTKVLNLRFQHERQRRQVDPDLPTVLDAETIRLEEIVKESLKNDRSLGEVSAAGIDWLMRHWSELDLSAAQKQALLGELRRPDYPELVGAVTEDLQRKDSKGFGEFRVHGLMLLDQLDALAERRPEVRREEAFVRSYLGKLLPGADEDMDRDPAVKEAYLERAFSFVSDLQPSFHSLKAHVLFARLQHDRSQGVYDEARFLQYLKLPRQSPWVNPKYRENLRLWRHPVEPSFNGYGVTGLNRIGNDESLVRAYLLHFLTGANDVSAFAPYLQDRYLNALHAEANIVAGLGDVEQWSSRLDPGAYQQLKERVDLEFDPGSRKRFATGETVALDVHVKNVKDLMVKIYEINTPNYYRSVGRQINTALDLDGLIAHEEQSFTYDDDPFKRVKRRFSFPQLDAERGAWVLEFIGNGKSSRAVIFRGGLQYLMRPSSAGHALRVLDERGQAVSKAYVWMQEKRYDPDEEGEILIPFSSNPGRQPIVLHDGDGFASLENLRLQRESYGLDAGFYVDREQLIAGQTARLAVRPLFSLNGAPSDLALLSEINLTVTSSDLDGVESSSTVKGFKLHAHKEAIHRFTVPDRLASLSFELSAKVRNVSQNRDDRLAARGSFRVNDLLGTDAVSDLYFSKTSEGYEVQLLGRTGEPIVDSALNFNVRRDDFRTDVLSTLRTDENGRVRLGALEGIYRVTAKAPNGRQYRWVLPVDQRHHPSVLHARVGEAIRLPLTASGRTPDTALLSRSGGSYLASHEDQISVRDGVLELRGLQPGDYHLFLGERDQPIDVKVTAGEERHGFYLAAARTLEKQAAQELTMAPLRIEDEELVIQLDGSNALTRIHLLGTRFQSPFDAFDALGRSTQLQPLQGRPAKVSNLYVSGRAIGDEYRYIIERRQERVFPGNMLDRPGLLLNPWTLRDTSTELEKAQAGQEWAATDDEPSASAAKRAAAAKREGDEGGERDPHTLEFLADTGIALYNLAPGADGELRIKLADLGDCRQVSVLATDPLTAVERHLGLPRHETKKLDLRLAASFNPKRHFTQRDQVSLLEPDEAFVIEDAAAAKFEVYETLSDVYQLFQTLGQGGESLSRFGFILEWPQLEMAQKREHYSEHASHELNFFLQRKDPEFFQAVVLPHLTNKKDLTFMDAYLLERDLSEYVNPWRFARLNVVERVLLAERLPDHAEVIVRDVREWLAQLPPEQRTEHQFFYEALGRSALESELGEVTKENAPVDSLSLAAPLLEAKQSLRSASRRMLRGAELADGIQVDAAIAGGAQVELRQEAASFGLQVVEENLELEGLGERSAVAAGFLKRFSRDRQARGRVQSLYRRLESTKELAENNYYRLPIESQTRELVGVNPFWSDYAQRESGRPFLSKHLTAATGNFTEMILALSVLDLPFSVEPNEDGVSLDKGRLTLKPSAVQILFHKEVREAAAAGQGTGSPLLVSQRFFRADDRYQEVNGEKADKFVEDEFLTGIVYGCQVVVTNPSSSRQRLDVLQQIPSGAIPVKGGKPTQNVALNLEPYATHAQEFLFYFPYAGSYAHFPVHVARGEKVAAFAEPFSFQVVEELSQVDTSSWAHVSQWGSEEEVLAYLNTNSLRQTDLSLIGWRVRNDGAFFDKVMALLEGRIHYDATLFSYGFHHRRAGAMQVYLQHANGFVNQLGLSLQSPLLDLDAVERHGYQHLEYSPLVNARVNALGGQRRILNDRFREQYLRFMQMLSEQPALGDQDRMSLAVYLLLQDRVADALKVFGGIDREALSNTMPYDYLHAYVSLYRELPSEARSIAQRYADYPVAHWRDRFVNVLAQVDEIEGKEASASLLSSEEGGDDGDARSDQEKLAANDPSLTFTVEDQEIEVVYRNLDEITINYYRMDLEFLFSTNPFVASDSARFSMIKPNRSDRHGLDGAQSSMAIQLPEEFEGENVLVELVGGGLRKASAYYSNQLHLRMAANYGHLQVMKADEKQPRPLPKTYVKVYAEVDGQPQFYKDGYTDLRGKFDYASLSTDEIERATRFSILVMSPEHGALVEEVRPPQR